MNTPGVIEARTKMGVEKKAKNLGRGIDSGLRHGYFHVVGTSMFVEVDTKRCAGCGLCEENHPHIFSMGPQFAVVNEPMVPESERESVRQTAIDCPAEAILITEYPKIED